MKRSTFFMLLCLLCGVLLIFSVFFFKKDTAPISVVTVQAAEPVTTSESFDKALLLRVLQGNDVCEMTLYDYLVGVVSAEMPATFPSEALKAQAIAARTFTLRQAQAKKHINADICTRSDCCQSWQAEENAVAKQAVEETDGLVITYEDQLIEATYFSCCGNRTESAIAVWGSDVPYLQSVESQGEETAPRYTDEINLTLSDFAQTLCAEYPQMVLSESPQTWIGKISYTKGGGIDTAIIGGVAVTGMELRKLFSLRSTDISFQLNADSITITTYGFGHRVGMSQYGAKAMAEQSSDFLEILTHYYQDVQIQRLCMEKTPLPATEEASILLIKKPC